MQKLYCFCYFQISSWKGIDNLARKWRVLKDISESQIHVDKFYRKRGTQIINIDEPVLVSAVSLKTEKIRYSMPLTSQTPPFATFRIRVLLVKVPISEQKHSAKILIKLLNIATFRCVIEKKAWIQNFRSSALLKFLEPTDRRVPKTGFFCFFA